MTDIDGNEVQEPRRDYYVYAYFYPGLDHPFYVGKGSGGRAWSHLSACKRTESPGLFYQMLRVLLERRVDPVIRILVADLTDSEAKDLEIELIERWGRIDLGTGCLTNQTRGGDGVVSLSESTRERMYERARATLREQRQLPEYRAQQSDAMTDYCKNPAAREARSQHLRDVWKNPSAREARIERIKAGWATSQRRRRRRREPVESFDLATGQVIKRYGSQTEAATDGFNQFAVSHVCLGKRRSHAGLGWRFAEPPLEES